MIDILKFFYDLDIKTIDQKSHMKIYDSFKQEDRQVLEIDYGDTPEKLKEDYLHMYKGIQSEVTSTTRFNDNLDLRMTYLGIVDTTKASKNKTEENSLHQNKGIW